MSLLKADSVSNPQGDKFVVSTIMTVAGGAPDVPNGWSPYKPSDFESYTTWPFETMVFPEGSSRGLYHEAYDSEAEAFKGHLRIVSMVRDGLEFPGETVEGPFGVPTLTKEQWIKRRALAGVEEASDGGM